MDKLYKMICEHIGENDGWKIAKILIDIRKAERKEIHKLMRQTRALRNLSIVLAILNVAAAVICLLA